MVPRRGVDPLPHDRDRFYGPVAGAACFASALKWCRASELNRRFAHYQCAALPLRQRGVAESRVFETQARRLALLSREARPLAGRLSILAEGGRVDRQRSRAASVSNGARWPHRFTFHDLGAGADRLVGPTAPASVPNSGAGTTPCRFGLSGGAPLVSIGMPCGTTRFQDGAGHRPGWRSNLAEWRESDSQAFRLHPLSKRRRRALPLAHSEPGAQNRIRICNALPLKQVCLPFHHLGSLVRPRGLEPRNSSV